MVFSTDFSQKTEMQKWLIGGLLLLTSTCVCAQNIRIMSANLTLMEDSYHLDALFEINITPVLEEALNKGLALHFEFEFGLTHPRWYTLYLWNDKLVDFKQSYRLSFNALTRQYRLRFGALHQSFYTLQEALAVLSRVRVPEILPRGELRPERNYEAQIRLRLNKSQLPKPFQVDAIASSDWTLTSEWYYWTVNR